MREQTVDDILLLLRTSAGIIRSEPGINSAELAALRMEQASEWITKLSSKLGARIERNDLLKAENERLSRAYLRYEFDSIKFEKERDDALTRLGKLQSDLETILRGFVLMQLEDGREKVWVRPVVEIRGAIERSLELSRAVEKQRPIDPPGVPAHLKMLKSE